MPLRVAGLVAVAGALAACGVGAEASAPTWVPQPSVTTEPGPRVSIPNPGPGPRRTAPVPLPTIPPGSPPSGSGQNRPDPDVVATGLNQPTGLTLLPDGSALVGERTTGRIVHVQPTPGQPVVTVRTLTGLDPSGGGGLLDLALSPTYSEDGLIYAYVTTATDNRVIDFTMTGAPATVLQGIPRGPADNTGRLLFGANGTLYVGTGDAGSSRRAADPRSLAGKVLHIDAIGQPAKGNPRAASPIFTSGHRTVNGLCTDDTIGAVFETEAPDEVNLLAGGANYGWPAATAGAQQPIARLPASHTGAAGCAVMGSDIFVATTDGKALLGAAINPRGTIGSFGVLIDGRYGRLLTVVASTDDDSLWVTTSNRDGHGTPRRDDDRVLRLRIVPTGGNGGSPA